MNEINTQMFQPRFLSGMVFAMIEGLIEGQTITLIYDNNPEDIHYAVGNAHLNHINYQLKYESNRNKWVMTISKNKTEKKQNDHGCCGICGGHS